MIQPLDKLYSGLLGIRVIAIRALVGCHLLVGVYIPCSMADDELTQTWLLKPGHPADCSSFTAELRDPKSHEIDNSLCRALNQLSCDPAENRCWHEFGAALDGQSFDLLGVRFTGYRIERGNSPIDWIEFELTPCRESDSDHACDPPTSGSNVDRIRGYIAYWHAHAPVDRSPITGPLGWKAETERPPSMQLPIDTVRSLDGTETMDNCLKAWGASREGAGLCRLEAMLDCETFVRGDRCQEVGWLLNSPASIKEVRRLPDAISPIDQQDLDLLFGELYFEEMMPEDLRGGIRRLDYRIKGYSSYYRGYPNLMRIDIESRVCFGDQKAEECEPTRFTPDNAITAYYVWWPRDGLDETPKIPMWLYAPALPLTGIQ